MMKGEVSIPENVNYFFKKLYNGNEGTVSAQKQRFIDSSSADAVYCCSGTKLLPGKHITHALTLKSMTGSRSVVTLEQRNGHCASNETVRRIEMGLEEGILLQESDNYVPNGVIKQPGLCMGTAWDNFDINIETLNGLGTIHHTYGIVYQNISSAEGEVLSSMHANRNSGRGFSKVACRAGNETIEPYYKKPKISQHDFTFNKLLPPKSFSVYSTRNVLWTIGKSVSPHDLPMWHGWNSLHEVDINPKQNVFYMQHIKLPPTRNDVVKETLRRSQIVAEECHEDYALVTYDLAVAKIAKQIQATEKPQFDNIFIMFGSFHTEMSYFSSLRRIIEGSGGPYVLTEVEVVAPGSLNKFLKGKMYNRCRRVHILFSTALHSLHFQCFMQDEEFSDEMKNLLKQWVSSDDSDVIPPALDMVALKYGMYCEETMSGVCGKTAQFWMMYCHLIDLYLLFHGAMKSCDVDLFTYALHEMSKIFFTTNHQNYAKWMTRYSLELLNLNQPLRNMLMDGGLSVRRSNNHFSRVGVDMA